MMQPELMKELTAKISQKSLYLSHTHMAKDVKNQETDYLGLDQEVGVGVRLKPLASNLCLNRCELWSRSNDELNQKIFCS